MNDRVSNGGIPARTWTIAALVLAFAFGIVYWGRVNPQDRSVLGGDSCQYLLLARSLKEGHGLQASWTQGMPAQGHVAPLFSALLIPFVSADSIDEVGARYFVVFCVIVSLILVFFLFAAYDPLWAIAIMFLTGMNSLVYLYGRSILTEAPYLCLSMLSFVLWEKFSLKAQDRRLEFLLALALIAAFFMRSAGIFLILAIFIRMAFFHGFNGGRGLLKRPFLFWGIVASVLTWIIWQIIVGLGSHQTYWTEFVLGDEGSAMTLGSLFERMIRGVYALVFYSIPQAVCNIQFTQRTVAAFVVTSIVLVGGWRHVQRDKSVLAIYLVLYCVATALWPWAQMVGARYVMPLLPVLLFCFFTGVAQMWECARHPLVKAAVAIALLLWGAAYALNSPFMKTGNAPAIDDSRSLMYSWVREHVPLKDLVVSFDPLIMYYYTSHQAPDYAVTTLGREQLRAILATGSVRWFVDDESLGESARVFQPLRDSFPTMFQLRHENGVHKVYEVMMGRAS